MSAVTSPWICPACKVPVTTPFCAGCGEHPLAPTEHTLRGLIHQFANTMSSIDSKLLRSLRDLMFRPGMLTAAYQNGLRKPYMQPFALFVMTNVLFFAAQAFTDIRIFSTQLEVNLQRADWSELARALTAARIAHLATTFAAFQPLFDQAVAVNAKSLMGLMVPPMALALPLVFIRRRQPFAVHVVFAAHFYAFLLVLITVPLLILAAAPLTGLKGLGSGMTMSDAMDTLTSVALAAICAGYFYVAIGRVYGTSGGTSGIWRWFQTAALVVWGALIFEGYKFTLFLITLYSVH